MEVIGPVLRRRGRGLLVVAVLLVPLLIVMAVLWLSGRQSALDPVMVLLALGCAIIAS